MPTVSVSRTVAAPRPSVTLSGAKGLPPAEVLRAVYPERDARFFAALRMTQRRAQNDGRLGAHWAGKGGR